MSVEVLSDITFQDVCNLMRAIDMGVQELVWLCQVTGAMESEYKVFVKVEIQ